jgi:CRISPR-associated exonuclease Cas4
MDIADESSSQKFSDVPEKRGYVGELNYPQLRQTKQIILSQKDRRTLTEKIIPNIQKIKNREQPPKTVEWDICKYCSYNELCYS